MIRILLPSLAFILLQACTSGKPGNQAFRVEGTLQDTTFDLLYLEEVPMETNRPAVVDSVRPDKSGEFTLNAPAAEDRIYYVRPAQQPYPLFVVVNDSKKVNVTVTFERVDGQLNPTYTVSGSSASQQIRDFSSVLNDGLRALLKDRIGLDTLLQLRKPDSLIRSVQENMLAQARALSAQADSALNQASTPSTYMLILGFYQGAASNPAFGMNPFTLEEIQQRLTQLSARFPDHNGLTTFQRKLEEEIQKSKGLIGQTAPKFTLPDANGKPIALNSFRGKWVLVDFWASWCRPCRMENPTVVAAYQQFKNKNFTVLGVSLDREDGKQDWLNAIREDKLDWTQVSDLKFWNSLVVPMYRIEGIPYNVLVDPQGKVVAENLRGPELAKKLQEVLR
jgi:peroxiredoxin